MKHPILLVFATFAILYIAADYFLQQQAPSFTIDQSVSIGKSFGRSIKATEHGIVIAADRRGHYIGSGLINGEPMQFMIDTGATWVAVPKRLAEKSGLQPGLPVRVKTANGEVVGYQTTIATLRIGTLTLHNSRAIIQDKLDEVLVGMSVLKQFRMTQQQGEMKIERL